MMNHYAQMVASNEFKTLVLLQNEHPESDILTITGFMAACDDWQSRLSSHLSCMQERHAKCQHTYSHRAEQDPDICTKCGHDRTEDHAL